MGNILASNTPKAGPVPCRVLVVDDEWSIRQVLHDFMALEAWDVTLAPSGEAALEELAQATFDVVVTDLKMGAVGGIEVLEAARKSDPYTVVVMMTGFGTVESAIEAMKKGAFDYILKPFKVPDLIRVVHRGLEQRRLQLENVQLKEILRLYHASEALGRTLSSAQVLDVLVEQTRDMVGCDALALSLREGVGLGLGGAASPANASDAPEAPARVRVWSDDGIDPGAAAWLDALDDAALMARLAESAGPEVLEGEALLALMKADAQRDGQPPSVMALPLRGRDGLVGVLAAMAFSTDRRHGFSVERSQLLSVLADRGAAAMENARLYEDLKATFRQTIQGLVQILESKDRYTRGHSERVKLYTTMIAEGLGWSDEEVRRIGEAALVHDIGKICIRVEDLNKDGPLTPSEYEMFKSHTTKGKWLLEPIVFLHDLIPAVYHHHERWDGRGYPMGLAGEDIPLDARIVAVADSYDAMTSNRPYRRALPHEVAVREIALQAGVQFDPDVAQVFLERIKDFKNSQRERRARWVSVLEAKGKRPVGWSPVRASTPPLDPAGNLRPVADAVVAPEPRSTDMAESVSSSPAD